MKLRCSFLVSFLSFVICGEVLAWCEYVRRDTNTGAVIERGGFSEENASLVFIGKVTSKIRWTPLTIEDERGKRPTGIAPDIGMEKNTFRVLEILKGPPLEEEIVIAFEGGEGSDVWHPFQVGKTYKIYTVDSVDLAFEAVVDSCYFYAREYFLSDDTHGATK
jgi:hypothetical protein